MASKAVGDISLLQSYTSGKVLLFCSSSYFGGHVRSFYIRQIIKIRPASYNIT